MTKRLGWLIGGAVALVLIIAVAAGIVLARSLTPDGPRTAGAGTASSGTVNGGRCGLPGTNSTTPITDRVTAGPVSFPVSAAPGWTPQRYVLFAPGSQSVGLRQGIPGQKWDAHAEIGLTTFAPRVAVAEAARRMLPCIVAGSRYDDYSPRLEGVTEPEPITVDGVPAARVTGRIMVRHPGLAVTGDVVTVVVIDSAPQAYFESDTPIGDEGRAAVARQIFEQLKVARDV